MFLFLIGIGTDLPTIASILFLLILLWLLAYYISRTIFRKVLKDASRERVNSFSRITAFIVSPILLIGGFALFVYIMVRNTPELSPEEKASQYYQMIDESIPEDLKMGMTKMEVLEILGDTDTTQSVLVYDLSYSEEKGVYVLEVSFENGRLTSFKRKQ